MAILFRFQNNPVNTVVAGSDAEDSAQLRKSLLHEGLEALGVSAESAGFRYLDSGRPVICGIDDNTPEEFDVSLSHSDGLLVLAVAKNGEVGIDIERKNRNVHHGLKKRILSESGGEPEKNIPPLQLWTIKEACLKLTGSGLRTAMNKIMVVPNGDGHFLARILLPGQTLDLHVQSFPHRQYLISVATSQEKLSRNNQVFDSAK